MATRARHEAEIATLQKEIKALKERKSKAIGDYTVKPDVEVDVEKLEDMASYNDDGEYVSLIPFIVDVYPSKQDIDMFIDMKELNRRVSTSWKPKT